MDDCLAWVTRAEVVLGSDLTSISDESAMIEAFGKHEQIYQEMDQQKDRIEAVLRRGSSMLDVIPEKEKKGFSDRLSVLFKRWSSLSERASATESNFDSFISNQENFYENLEGFVGWMRRLGLLVSEDIDENVERDEHRKHLFIHKEYCKDIKQHEQMYEMLIKNGEKILEGLPNKRKVSFQEQLQKLKEGWDNLIDVAIEKEEDLVDLSGVDDEHCVLSRSNSNRKEPVVNLQDEAERLSKDLDVIEDGLEKVRKGMGSVVGNTDIKMKHHLKICLRSDAEMEKIEEVIRKASRLPVESEERMTIDAKIGELKMNWDDIAETLHRERSDLEKTIEMERNLDAFVDEYHSLENALADCHSLEDLETGLEKMISFIDKYSDIQENIMRLTERKGNDVKVEMMETVVKILEKAFQTKDNIRIKVETLREKDSLIAEIDQLMLRVAMLNQTRTDISMKNNEDAVAELSSSIKMCNELIEKTLSLKSQIVEHSAFQEKGAELFGENLRDIEGSLRTMMQSKEKELTDLKTSKQLIDLLLKDVSDGNYEELMDDLLKKISVMKIEEIGDVLQDAHNIKCKLEKQMEKAIEIERCFPEQNGNAVGILMEELRKQTKDVYFVINFVELCNSVSQQSNVLNAKLNSIKDDIQSLQESENAIEMRVIFGYLEKDFKIGLEELKSDAEKIRDSEEDWPMELKDIEKDRRKVLLQTLDDMLVQFNGIRVVVEESIKFKLIEEGLQNMTSDPLLSLEDRKEHLEGVLKEIEQLHSDLVSMNGSTEMSGLVVGVIGRCATFKQMICNEIEEVSKAISDNILCCEAVKNCEILISKVENGIENEDTIIKLQQKVQDMRRDLEKHSSFVKMHGLAKEMRDVNENGLNATREKNVLEESDKTIEKLTHLGEKLDDFVQTSSLLKSELKITNAAKLDEFMCIDEAEAFLKDSKDKEDSLNERFKLLLNTFEVLNDLLKIGEDENMMKEISANEKEFGALIAGNSRLESDLKNAKNMNEEINTRNCEILEKLESSSRDFDANFNKAKSFDEIGLVIDAFSWNINTASDELKSLLQKDLNIHLPSKEREETIKNLRNTNCSITSANSSLENRRRKINELNKEMKHRECSIENVEKWIEKLEGLIHQSLSANFEKELENLVEIEKEVEGISNEIGVICSITVNRGEATKSI